MTYSLRLLAFALLAVPLALTGCDAIEEAAGLNEVDVPLGAAGRNVPVMPNSLSFQTGSVSISQNIPGSPGVDGINVLTQNVTFAAREAPRGAKSAAGSCELGATLLIDNTPAVTGTVSIVDDVVTAVSVGYASADYDRARLCEAIGAEVCPVGNDLTSSEIDGIIESALNSGDFEAGVVIDNPGDCDGELTVEEVTFDLNL